MSSKCISILLSFRGISKMRESWEDVLKGLIWRTDLASSQHNSYKQLHSKRQVVKRNLATEGDSPDLLMRDELIELATREERIH
jgi:hypothetical protein